jgi:hypothetical protein
MTNPEPTPPPQPTPPITYPAGPPEDLQPFPMAPEGHPGPDGTWQVPQYPPYIPESQFDTSQGMPRSTLDGIHGTGDDEPMRWKPSYPGELPPFWMNEYVQDQNDPDLWWPDKRPDAPGSVHPAGHKDKTDQPGDANNTHTAAGVFEVDYGHLEGLAQSHDDNAGKVSDWAQAEPGFADQLLETHGKVAYATYLNVKGYNDERATQAAAYAGRQADTATGLRGAIASTRGTDEANAAAFGPTGLPPTTSI